MVQFKSGDVANVIRRDGSEATVRIDGFGSTQDTYIVTELEIDGIIAGPRVVNREHLLRPKGPFFEVRGLVFTTSTLHPGEQGEIVALGHSPNNQAFYRVKFADGSTEWFSENDVVIENEKRPSSMETWAALGS